MTSKRFKELKVSFSFLERGKHTSESVSDAKTKGMFEFGYQKTFPLKKGSIMRNNMKKLLMEDNSASQAIEFSVSTSDGDEIGSGQFNLHHILDTCTDVTHHPIEITSPSGSAAGQLYIGTVAYQALNEIFLAT
jgi:hypothetical protein